MTELLTPAEVDEVLRLNPGQAQRMAKRGQLPAIVLPGGLVRFHRDAILNLTRPASVAPQAKEQKTA